MKVLREYRGIADNCNLMAELGWPRRKVAAVGRSLAKKGLVTYRSEGAPSPHPSPSGGEGGIVAGHGPALAWEGGIYKEKNEPE